MESARRTADGRSRRRARRRASLFLPFALDLAHRPAARRDAAAPSGLAARRTLSPLGRGTARAARTPLNSLRPMAAVLRVPGRTAASGGARRPRFRPHHAFLVSQILAHVEEAIETVSQQIDMVIAPFTSTLERLGTIPGVKRRTP